MSNKRTPTGKTPGASGTNRKKTAAPSETPAAEAPVEKPSPAPTKPAVAKPAAAKAVVAKPVVGRAKRVLETKSLNGATVSTHPKPVAKAKRVAANDAAPSRYKIFQIYYEPWHVDLLDPMFEPYDNCNSPSELMEFDIFERIARSNVAEGSEYWGALSWRFTEKTGLTGADLIEVMEKSPDVDLFFCNPHVHNESLYHNMWVQGETSHPRFLEISRALFEATGLPPAEFEQVMPARSYSAANYFVGKAAFWDAYLPFIRKIVTRAEQKMSAEARKLLHSSVADDRGLHGGSTYLPFIVERLVPLFLQLAGKHLKVQRISLPSREQELNIHLKMLRDMKDVAIQTKSPWLAACWVNYRALYMSQHNGREWCQKYLRSITPTQIKFPDE